MKYLHMQPWEVSAVAEQAADADALTLQRVARGDRQALAELYARYRQSLFHYLLQFTSDRGLAEELLQDTFVAVWKSAQSFEGRSCVQAWLFGIARRRACKTLHRSELPVVDATELETLPATDPEPEAALESRLARDALVAAIAQLAPVHREVLLLTFVHGLSYAESADVLGVPVGTVKSRLSNARRAARALLSTRSDEVGT